MKEAEMKWTVKSSQKEQFKRLEVSLRAKDSFVCRETVFQSLKKKIYMHIFYFSVLFLKSTFSYTFCIVTNKEGTCNWMV